MRVGTLGSGLMGGKLGTLFARAGQEVAISHTGSSTLGNRTIKHLTWRTEQR